MEAPSCPTAKGGSRQWSGSRKSTEDKSLTLSRIGRHRVAAKTSDVTVVTTSGDEENNLAVLEDGADDLLASKIVS